MAKFNSKTGAEAGMRSSRKGKGGKATEALRMHFASLVEANLDKLQSDLDSLKPKDRLEVILQMSKFLIPTLKAVDIHAAPKFTPIQINLITSKTSEDAKDN